VYGSSAVVTPAGILKKTQALSVKDIVFVCDDIEDAFNVELDCEASSYQFYE